MSHSENLAIIILAAGKGSRMKSSLPKVMHKIAGRSMLGWLIERCESLNPDKIILVAAPGMDDVVAEADEHDIVYQAEQRGTGDAVKPAMAALKDFDGRVLVLLGDEPFVDVDVLREMIAHDGVAAMGLTLDNPTGMGRMVLDNENHVQEIIEEKDCTDEQRKIKKCGTGNYCFDAASLREWLPLIKNDNAQNEYYLTDLPHIALAQGIKTKVFAAETNFGWGVNTHLQLAEHEAYAQNILRHAAMENGVTMIDPQSVTLSWDTEFGADVVIEPHVFIGPWTDIESHVTIHAFSYIEGAMIEAGAQIGPYARIRPKSVIGQGACVGNFIEVNRSTLKAGAKAKHVSYLGDAMIGEKANIGAGTVIANYDGFFKHETTIGEKVFIGSNSTLIAPVDIEDGAIVAAGSNINKNVGENAMAIGRTRQENHAGWATQYRFVKKEQKKIEEED